MASSPSRPPIADAGQPLTHDDYMPTTMHEHRLVSGPRVRALRPYYHGSYAWTPQFAKWISQSCAPTVAPEFRPAETWWQNGYVRQRLATLYPPILIQALVRLRARRAAFLVWEQEEWDGWDEEAWDRAALAQNTHIAQLAHRTREEMGLAHRSHEHAVAWLTRQDEQVLRQVRRTFYPSNRQRHLASTTQRTT